MVVVVTGASSGIGQSIAEYLALDGFKVYGTSRHIQTPNDHFKWLRLDVNDKASIEEAINSVFSDEGRIDVLINNAGIGMISSFEEAPQANIDVVMDTNLGGVLRMSQAVLPKMRKQKSGIIINISSIAGLIGLPYRSIYSASKFAVEGLTEALRTEVAKFGIQVCSVQPGSIKTNIKGSRVSYVPANSAYQPEISIAEKIIDEEVAHGIDSDEVAKFVAKLVKKNRLASKYVVANPFQKFGTSLKRYIPTQIFERLLIKRYRGGQRS